MDGIVQLEKVLRGERFMADVTFETFVVNHFVSLVFFVFGEPFRTLTTGNDPHSTLLVRNEMAILPEQSFERFLAHITFEWFRFWFLRFPNFVLICRMYRLFVTLQ